MKEVKRARKKKRKSLSSQNTIILNIIYKYLIIIIIIIYHDFLHPPRRGSHVKSDNTHTIINIHPLAHILDTFALIFSSCLLFTVYPTPLQVITTRARETGPKEHRAKQKWSRDTHSVTYVPYLSTLSDLSCIDAQPPAIPPLPKPTFTPSIQPNLGFPHTRPPLTSAINTLQAIRYSSILSTCPNHLNTL